MFPKSIFTRMLIKSLQCLIKLQDVFLLVERRMGVLEGLVSDDIAFPKRILESQKAFR